LQFEKYPDFWNQFCCYELAEPSDAAIVQLLGDRVAATNLQAKSEEYSQIARRNDKTFRNIIENLRTAKNRNLVVSVEQLSESLDRTWRLRYKSVVKRYPVAQYIYDAVEMLQVLNLDLNPAMIEATAGLFIQQHGVKRLWKQLQLRQALRFLINSERILKPRDGQIEAKGRQVDVGQYISLVLQKLADVGKTYYSQNLLASEFVSCGTALRDLERYESAMTCFSEALKHKADDYYALWFRGVTLRDLGRYEDAITSFDEVLKHKPDDYRTFYFRGVVFQNLGRYEDAIASFNEALEYKTDHSLSWGMRSIAFKNLGRYEDALTSLDEALKYKSDDHGAWYLRGVVLRDLGRYDDAVTSFDEALKHQPNNYYHYSWNSRGIALRKLKRYDDAVTSFDEALKHKPDYHETWNSRGLVLKALRRYEDAIISFDKALEHESNYQAAWYHKACCYALQGQAELSSASLKTSIELNLKYREKARTNSDFDSIRDDDRFQALINAE
jgi:tetratricopeptide (TPR) repeat protein